MLTEVTRIFPYQGRVDRPFVLWTGTIEEHDRGAFRAHGIELKSIDSKETFFRFLSHSAYSGESHHRFQLKATTNSGGRHPAVGAKRRWSWNHFQSGWLRSTKKH